MLEVTILSVLQGIAEFLPISSSGHLVLGKSLLGLGDVGIRLDIFLHVGTLFAVCAFYWRIIRRIALGAFGRFFCAFLAGVVFWGKPEDYAGSVILYSIVYNGAYMLPDALICMLVGLVPQIRGLAKAMRQGER